MSIKAVIFDLDGVIVSTDKYHYKAWKKIADDEGIFFDETINNRLRGVSRMESLAIILERADRTYSDEEKASLAERKNNHYRQSLAELSPQEILPGANEAIETLKAQGLKLAIGSSSKNTPFILQQIGLSDCFLVVADGNQITKGKPDPEVFLLAASKLGVPPEECIVIEDAISGVEAAKAGGMTAVYIGGAEECAIADYSIKRLDELIVILSQ